MFCTECGSENSDGGEFCSKCGAQLKSVVVDEIVEDVSVSERATKTVAATAVVAYSRCNIDAGVASKDALQPASQKPKKKKAPLIIAIVAALFLVAAGVLLIPRLFGCDLLGSDAFEMATSSISSAYSEQDDETKFYIDGKAIDGSIDGPVDLYASLALGSADGTKRGFIGNDGTAYVVSKDGIIKIASDVSYFRISPNGSSAVYADEKGMHMTSVTADEVRDIVDISGESSIDNLRFSPDDKTIVFNVIDKDTELMAYSEGELVSFGEALTPITTANAGEYIYCYNEDSLYCANMKTGDKEKIASDFIPPNSTRVYPYDMNEMSFCYKGTIDGTELLFVTKDGLFYISKNNETQKIDNGVEDIQLLGPNAGIGRVKSLKNHVYKYGNDLYYLDSSLKFSRIVDSPDGVNISVDGKTLFYTDDNRLYKMDAKAGAKAKELADDASYSVKFSKDTKHVYYLNKDGDLMYLNGAGDSACIDSDVHSSYFSAVVTDNGKCYYIIADENSSGSAEFDTGTLYCSDRGGDTVKVDDGLASEVIIQLKNQIYYQKGDKLQDIYFIDDGKDPVKLD